MNKIDEKKVLNERVYYLDAMRGILMMLGVFYHSALVFRPNTTWAIHSDNTTQVAFFLTEIISSFRMEAFFIISGYFVLFTIKKYGPDIFIKVRIKRILIPLLTTALTLNVIQAFLAKGDDWLEYYLNGGWISHLWFLWNLIFYFSIVYIIYKFFKKKLYLILKIIDEKILKLPLLLVMFILPTFTIMLLVIGKILPTTIYGIHTNSILEYMPYFAFGMLLLRDEKLLKKFASIQPILSLLIALIAYALYYYFPKNEGNICLSIAFYFRFLSAWFGSAIAFYIFMNFFNKQSSLLYFLADASYTVYLFHQVLVVGFGLILIKLNIGGVFGLSLLIISVLIVSILIHTRFISKIKVLKFLYNGK